MAPPIIFGLKPTSFTALSMPTEFERIGADHDDIGICRLDRAHHRGEVGGRRWVSLVVNDLESVLLGIRSRTLARVVGELRVRRHQRRGLRFRVLHSSDLKEAVGK